MSPLDPTNDALLQAQNAVPEREEGAPLFIRAWHTRAFALIVTLVKDSRISWTSFQERLVRHLAHEQAHHKPSSPDEIDLQYFDCWLAALEETLVEEQLIKGQEILEKISVIRENVNAIRTGQ